MRKHDTDPLAVTLLVLGVTALAGMLLGSWQLVLYASLLLIGALLALALARRGAALAVGFPLGVVALLAVLFVTLHVMGIADPPGTGSFLGWDPMTALYLFGVGPAFLLVGLLYALVDRPIDSARVDSRPVDPTLHGTDEETAR